MARIILPSGNENFKKSIYYIIYTELIEVRDQWIVLLWDTAKNNEQLNNHSCALKLNVGGNFIYSLVFFAAIGSHQVLLRSPSDSYTIPTSVC